MASNCEDVSAQMMELLYGELPADARANVDAHVAGCARCRSELESFEKTRAVARRGLDEEPPARARAAIMQAAAAHLAAQARPAARRPAAPEHGSFWDRVRARWAFPTLATVGAVAVFLIANRVFLNPERTLELHGAGEAKPPAAAPAEPAPVRVKPIPPPAPELARKMAPAEGVNPEAKAPAAGRSVAEQPSLASRPRGGARAWVDPLADDLPPAAETGAGRRADDGRAFGKDAGKMGKNEAPKMKAKKAEEDVARFAAPPPAAKPEVAAAKVQDLEKRPFAPPPPPRESPAAKHLPADKAPAALVEGEAQDSVATKSAPAPRRTAPSAASPKGSLDGLMATEGERQGAGSAGGLGVVGGAAGPRKGDGLSGAAQAAPAPRPVVVQNQAAKRAATPPAPAPAATAPAMAASPPPAPPAPQQTKNRLRRAESEPASDEGAWAAESSDAKEEKKQSAGNKQNAAETLKQRADRLFAEGRWNEAAVAYRELLRREPHSGDADRWRQRLAVAENADTSERNRQAAKRARKAPAKAAADADSAAAQ